MHDGIHNASSLSLQQDLGSQHWQVSVFVLKFTAERHDFWTMEELFSLDILILSIFGVVWEIVFALHPVLSVPWVIFFIPLNHSWLLEGGSGWPTLCKQELPLRFHVAFLPLSQSSLTENLECQRQFLLLHFFLPNFRVSPSVKMWGKVLDGNVVFLCVLGSSGY